MNILFLHQNFPGQFVHLARHLERSKQHSLLALVPDGNARRHMIAARTYPFTPATGVQPGVTAHYSGQVERGIAAARAMMALRAEGFVPDLVLGHGGWGETLFVRDVWPTVRIVLHAEFYYQGAHADIGFDPEFPVKDSASSAIRARVRNTGMTLALLDADQAVAPTQWQRNSFPAQLRGRITLAHEGIATQQIRPDPTASVTLERDDVVLRHGDEVVTFVARNLEPYRGYHMLMRALPGIMAQRPAARIVIVGGNGVSYGSPAPAGQTWKQLFLDEVSDRLDMRRIHFVGRVSHADFVRLMQVSAAHVYLTYPFVLSWSMLEAMSAGALVIGSRTPPVEEVIQHGQNGMLVDFFDPDALATTVCEVLRHPARYASMRRAARQTVIERFDLDTMCLPAWLDLVGR